MRKHSTSKGNLEKWLTPLVDAFMRGLAKAIASLVREQTLGTVLAYFGGGGDVEGYQRRSAPAKRDYSCLSPGCRRRSKGPLFHYLCEKHEDTPKAVYEKWREARMRKRARRVARGGMRAAA